jgi:glycosyltransferase involved in cell wall biosynthesis
MLLTTWRYRYIYNAAIVEVFSGKSFIWAELVSYLLWLMKKPFILALYGGRLPDFALKQKRRVRFLFSLAEVVIGPSTYLQTEMKPYRSDILLFPYGVKIEEFIFRQRISPLPCLTSLRGFHSIYNPQLAPKVIALLLSEFPNANLVMIGGDKGDGSWGKTGQLIKTLGFEDRVKMLGWVERESVPKLLNKADIFLNTPNVDNTPLSIIEAMPSGLCIVSTNVGGVPYLIDDGHDALLVPPDDPDAMAAAVRRILTEPGLAERLSRNARKKAEHYD